MNLKNNFKSLIYFLFNLVQRTLPNRAVILMYHSVGDNGAFFSVDKNTFAKQMEYLHKNNFQVISLEKLVKYLKSKTSIPAKTIILTFDDGYVNNYTNAFPILQKYHFLATIFLTTGNIDQPGNLNWQQIKEMHDSGLIDFQPHTVSHPKLSQLTAEQIEQDIQNSKQIIEDKLNKECNFFAYPYGDYNDQVIATAKKYFTAAVTVTEGIVQATDNPMKLKRNAIDSSTTWPQFRGKVLGISEKFVKIKRIYN